MRLSLELLILKYQKSLFAAAYNICGNADDANDIVQETFIQYFSTNKEFNDEQHLHAWLLRVAINKSKNLLRSAWNNKIRLTDELHEYSSEEKLADLMEEILRLPERYRIVIHLHYYEGFSVKEISELLETSEGAVKMQLSRGRKALKKILEEEQS